MVGTGRQEEVHVLGVDILQDQPFRQYTLRTSSGRQPPADEFLRLLADPTSAIVPEVFAARHGLAIGSRLDVVFGDLALQRSREWTRVCSPKMTHPRTRA